MSTEQPMTGTVVIPRPGDPGSGPGGRWTVADVKARTLKRKDAWWTVLFVDPTVAPLVAVLASRTSITPNTVTYVSLLLGLASAGVFWLHTWPWLVLGAGLYHLSFMLDCVDGKISRLKGNGSAIGGLLDYIFDRIRVMVVTLGLFGGQYHATGQARYLYAGLVTVFLDGLRYMDALQIVKVRRTMSMTMRETRIGISRAVTCLETLQELRGGFDIAVSDEVEAALTEGRRSVISSAKASTRLEADSADDAEEASDALPASAASVSEAPPEPAPVGPARAFNREIQTGFNRRLPWYPAFREAMIRHRVRPHLFSGIEFQMFVFIIGPLVNQVLPVMIASGVALLGFEVVIMIKLGMSTKEFVKLNARARALAGRLAAVTEKVDPDGTLRQELQAATASS